MSQFTLKQSKKSRFLFDYGNLLLLVMSIFALSLTFGVAVSNFYFSTKVLAFAFVVTTYLLVYVILHTMQKNQVVEVKEVEKRTQSKQIFEAEIDEKLLVLEEAGKFFGASLKSNDMFRLISSRISEIIPYSSLVVFRLNDENMFSVPFAVGKNARLLESLKLECGTGIAGKAFLSRQIECEETLNLDNAEFAKEFLSGLDSAIAIPIFSKGEISNVIVMYSDKKSIYQGKYKILAEALGERITPLINSSIEYEKSLSNALTDNLTALPNERAFFMVLENQVAEAQRFIDRRLLTILAVDIKNFTEINEKYGFEVGNRILAETADRIKNQIRRMDFIARTVKDEFLLVLPTASEEITRQVIDRVMRCFENNPILVSSTESCHIELGFGFATFKEDGNTANELLKTALLRKQQNKTKGKNSILFFPKKYVS